MVKMSLFFFQEDLSFFSFFFFNQGAFSVETAKDGVFIGRTNPVMICKPVYSNRQPIY